MFLMIVMANVKCLMKQILFQVIKKKIKYYNVEWIIDFVEFMGNFSKKKIK